jgi:hypothetical protein
MSRFFQKVAYFRRMPARTFIENQLRRHFNDKEFFSREDLLQFYRQFDREVTSGALGWRIFDLKKRHIIKNVRTGIYTLEQKQTFHPAPDLLLKRIGKFLETSLDHHFYNVWTTAWLNELIELQATSFLYVLEVDRDSMQGVFFNLRDSGISTNLFLKPDEKVIENYISELDKALVIEPMITRAPVMKVKNIIFPTLEKILVDLYCEEKLFFAYQGHQLAKIYEACFDKYIINFSRLFNYSKRRKREEGLKSFLLDNVNLYEKIKEVIE